MGQVGLCTTKDKGILGNTTKCPSPRRVLLQNGDSRCLKNSAHYFILFLLLKILLCCLCFLKALSLQNRSNSNLFPSKLELSISDPFLCSHPSTPFPWNSFFFLFLKIFLVLFFVFVFMSFGKRKSCNCFKWCPSLLQVTAAELFPIL